MHTFHRAAVAALGLATYLSGAIAAVPDECRAQSGTRITPVIELYTSEGCSSCPPADRWLSGLGRGTPAPAVVQAFHVAYWDYIGWVDRFAQGAHTLRQRQIAQWNQQGSIYTPQLVLNGRDWRDWHRGSAAAPAPSGEARFELALRRIGPDQFEAQVNALPGAPADWSAYWTVTENGHSSKVKAGENAGELLRHDHVVRQYTQAGNFATATGVAQRLTLRTIPAAQEHPRRVNLVVFEPRTGRTLQAVSAACTG